MEAAVSSSTASPTLAPEPHLANPDLNPSFTKGVFLGEIRESLVFPFPVLAPDEQESQTQVLDAFRAFAADTIDSHQLDVTASSPTPCARGCTSSG